MSEEEIITMETAKRDYTARGYKSANYDTPA
jgi:hypothetical protein